MNNVCANIMNETQKIFYRKKTIVFMILSLAITVCGAALISVFQGQVKISAMAGGDYPVLILGLYTLMFLPLFIFMAAGESFSGEMGNKTLKLVLTRPISRFKIFISKNIALAIYVAANMAVVFIASVVCSFFISRGNTLLDFGNALTAYLTAFIPMLSISIASVFFAQFFRNSSGALTVSILIYAAAKIAAMIVPGIAAMSLFSLTDWYMLWLGNSFALQKIAYGFILMLSYSIIFFSAGFYMFDKKEL